MTAGGGTPRPGAGAVTGAGEGAGAGAGEREREAAGAGAGAGAGTGAGGAGGTAVEQNKIRQLYRLRTRPPEDPLAYQLQTQEVMHQIISRRYQKPTVD